MSDILVVSPGGRSSTGGICRMVDYTCLAWAQAWTQEGLAGTPAMRVIDSGGMSRGPSMAIRFAGALLAVGRDCVLGRAALLHIHVAANGSVLRKAPFILLARATGVASVLHMHGADFETFHARIGTLGRRLVGAVFRQAGAVIVLGGRARRHAINAVGLDPRRVHVLPNAVPDAAHAPPIPATDAPCHLLFLGALTERKGLPELFDALARDEVRALSWSLALVGDGDASAWKARVDQRGLADRVEFLGWKPSEDARAMLAGADLLVVPSRQEALPMVILEAMSAGRAVLATDVGDVSEAVAQGDNGLLVPPGDARALGEALARLIASPSLRAQLGEAGRRRFEAAFDLRTYSARLQAIFARARSETTRPPKVSTRARETTS